MKERATPLEVGLYEEGDVYKEGDWYWVKIKGEWQPDVPIVRSDFGKPIDPSLIGNPRNPEERAEAVSRAKAIVIATTHFNDAKIVADASRSRHRHHEGPRRRRHPRARPHANPRLVTIAWSSRASRHLAALISTAHSASKFQTK